MKAKRKAKVSSPLSSQIMVVLWEPGASRLQAVQGRRASTKRRAYRTVKAMLRS